jgi:hypothetical protein
MNYLNEDPRAAREQRVSTILGENRSWKTKYRSLIEAATGKDTVKAGIAQNAILVMENQARYMSVVARDKRMEATFTNALGTLVPKILDVVRIFYPNLIAHKLVDIQPMDRQNGQIVLVKPVYTSTAGGVTAGNQVFKQVTDGTYASENLTVALGTGTGAATTLATLTGAVTTLPTVPIRAGSLTITAGAIVATDNGSGLLTGTGITSGTINYTTGAMTLVWAAAPANLLAVTGTYRYDSEQNTSAIRSLDIQITNLPITAQPHPLKVTWSQQSQFAAEAHFDLDLGDMMTNLVASFIKQERDMQLINQIIATATAEATLNFDAAPPANYSRLARYAEIGVKLDQAESLIQTSQGRGGVSWILCGINAANIWSQASGFKPSGVTAPIGPYEIGTLRDGTVSVIKVPTMSANTYIVGFKGYVIGDSAIVLGEWIPLYATPVFQAPDLYNSAGMMSLYASVVNNSAYYRSGTISNYVA